VTKNELIKTEHEIYILARTIWGEARNQGHAGMVFVGGVVLERAQKGGWWGKTIKEVCTKKKQFSCWNENDPNLDKLLHVNGHNPEFCTALGVAAELLAGNIHYQSITNGATHYHTASIEPEWTKRLARVVVVGDHIGYA